MFREYIEKFMLFFALLAISCVVVFVLNLQNIDYLRRERVNIDNRQDYKLDELSGSERVTIKGTLNNIFKSVNLDGEGDIYYFALQEYAFDFILLSDKDTMGENVYRCINITNREPELLLSLIAKFNTPITLEGLANNNLDNLDEDVREALSQNTRGNFGNETRLLDCTEARQHSDFEIQFLIFAEVLVIFSALIFLFRETFLNFIEDIQDGVPGNND